MTKILSGEAVTIDTLVTCMPNSENAVREVLVPIGFTRADGSSVKISPYTFTLKKYEGEGINSKDVSETLTRGQFMNTVKPGDQIQVFFSRVVSL